MVGADTWIHLACVMGTGTLSVYLDGTLYRTVACNYVAPDGPLWISAQAGAAPTQCFRGAIADLRIFGGAQTAAELAADRLRRLCGYEPRLFAHYPLERDASDNTPTDATAYRAAPRDRLPSGSAHRAGSCLSAELSDWQIWDRARDASDIRSTMHLTLTGGEAGLAVGYRLGALLPDDEAARLADFSIHGLSGARYRARPTPEPVACRAPPPPAARSSATAARKSPPSAAAPCTKRASSFASSARRTTSIPTKSPAVACFSSRTGARPMHRAISASTFRPTACSRPTSCRSPPAGIAPPAASACPMACG